MLLSSGNEFWGLFSSCLEGVEDFARDVALKASFDFVLGFINSPANIFLGARYRRIARRRGKQKAIFAIGNSIPTVVYHLLSDPTPGSATSVPDTWSEA